METYVATREQLMGVSLPEQTKTYKPVSHAQLIDLTLESIDKSGFKLASEEYSASQNGQIANGKFAIANLFDTEMQLQIGWQNSYNKKLTLKFAIGSRIFICSNGCVRGDFGSFKRKHVGDVQEFTPEAITEYIKRSSDVFTLMQSERDAMKSVGLTARDRSTLVGRMFLEEELITATQLGIIAREIKAPTHDYNAEDSLWELYNYTTFAYKEINPALWMSQHMSAHEFFVSLTK